MKIIGVGWILWNDISTFLGKEIGSVKFIQQKTYGLICEDKEKYIVVHNEVVDDQIKEADFTLIPKSVKVEIKIYTNNRG